MKRFGWILVVLIAASPAWAAKNITVQQLKDILAADQQAKKTDAEVANELKQVALTEELTTVVMNSLAPLVPGAAALEQIYVLEAKSAVLAAPATDIPATPAPDAAAQKALLDKALDYASKTYAQLPVLTATKTTIRFQDNASAMASSSGMHSAAASSSADDPNLVNAAEYIHYINTAQTTVNLHNGIEDNPLAKDKTRWGANGYIALLGQGPVLSTVLQEASGAGKLNWLRWETVNGKAAAVFSFTVEKKKSHYAVNYCCFPNLDQAGVMDQSLPGAKMPGTGSTPNGNMQTTTEWKNYKATLPYHGEVFIDPDSGIVVRLITQAEFKNSDLVHLEDQRIDYLPVAVGGKTLVLPSKTIVNTEVVPNGDSGGGKFILRHTLFTSEYKGYQAGS
jgi:hypothetical protein